DRPALQRAAKLQPEIIMQIPRVVLLNDEAQSTRFSPASLLALFSGLRGDLKIAFTVIYTYWLGHVKTPADKVDLLAGTQRWLATIVGFGHGSPSFFWGRLGWRCLALTCTRQTTLEQFG